MKDQNTGREQNADNAEMASDYFPQIPTYVDPVTEAPAYMEGTPAGAAKPMPKFDPHADLARLRFEFPFLPITPYPQKVITVVLDGTTPVPVEIPSGVTMVKFSGPGDWYISIDGAAAVPPAGANAVINGASLHCPRDYFYSRGVQHVSIASDKPTTVQVWCWYTNRWPEASHDHGRDV